MATGFVAASIRRENEIFSGHKVGTVNIMPTKSGWLQHILHGLLDDHEPGGTRTQHPLVGIGSHEIDVIQGRGKSSNGLNGIQTKGNASLFEHAPYGFDFESKAAEKMTGSQGHHPNIFINLPLDIDATDAAWGRHIEESYLDAPFGESHPWIHVGGIIVLVDQNRIPLAPWESRSNEAQCQTGRPHQSNLT